MKKREKASQVAAKNPPYLATPGTFDQTFPTVTDFTIEIEEDDGGWPIKNGKSRFTFANRSTMPSIVNCTNRLCYNGGVSIQRLLESMIASGKTTLEIHERCQGYAGSPAGRRRYRDCVHGFKIFARVTLPDTAQ